MEFENFILTCTGLPEDYYVQEQNIVQGGPKFEREWKERNTPWTKYVANTSIYNCTGDVFNIQQWCEENLIGKFDLCVPVYFELEEDCVLFILKWC